jgi:hypothetical protein
MFRAAAIVPAQPPTANAITGAARTADTDRPRTARASATASAPSETDWATNHPATGRPRTSA